MIEVYSQDDSKSKNGCRCWNMAVEVNRIYKIKNSNHEDEVQKVGHHFISDILYCKRRLQHQYLKYKYSVYLCDIVKTLFGY